MQFQNLLPRSPICRAPPIQLSSFCEGFALSLQSRLAALEQHHETFCVHPAADEGDLWKDSLVLKGFVDREGETTRLTVKLLNSDQSVQLREYSVEASLTDTRLLQGGIISDIASMLELDLPSGAVAVSGGTAISEAYDAYLEGLAYLEREELGEAISVLRKAVRYDPHYASALGGLCEAFRRMHGISGDREDLRSAEQKCVAALKESSDLPAVHVSLGRIRAAHHQNAKAAEHFWTAAELDPLYPDLPGLYKRLLGDLEKTELTYQRRAQLRPACFSHQNNLGIFYMEHGQYEKAEGHYRRAISLAPNYYRAYTNLGNLYARQRRYQNAAAMLQQSLSLKPTALAYANLGTVLFYAGQYEEAVARMEQARDLGQTGYFFWGNLAEAYRVTPQLADMAAGVYTKAAALAEEERVKNRDDAWLLSNLAHYYARLGRNSLALREITEARRLDPHDVEVLYRSVSVYEILERRNEALAAADAALQGGYPCDVMREAPDLHELRKDHRYHRIEETRCVKGTALAAAAVN